MIGIVISPSKTMDFRGLEPASNKEHGICDGKEVDLRNILNALDFEGLKELYGASDKVVREAMTLNGIKKCYKAIELFNGAVFKNLDYGSLDQDASAYIDRHVMVFSAMYGIVPAGEAIRPYRLDLSNSLKPAVDNLSVQWKEPVNAYIKEQGIRCIIDLASTEYRRLMAKAEYECYISVEFKDEKNGKLKTVGTYAKMARGQFLRAIAEANVTEAEALKDICVMGYTFNETLSDESNFIFTR